jgi:hypothetical protein
MKKNILTFIAAFCCFVSYANAFAYHDKIDLQGKWQFALDTDAKLSVSSTFNDFVTLPGTTDTNRKGTPCTKKDETTHLSRLFSYAGRAWYRRTVDIPKTWKKKVIRLHLERTKPTTVFIDGKLVGTSNDISTAQTYDLSQVIKPGKHEITIMVDNGSGVPKQLYANSHAYTEDTQTNWNGIIGQMYLDACDPIHISDMKTYPDIDHATLQIKVSLSGKLKKDNGLTLYILDNSDAHSSKAYPCNKYLKYSFNGTDYEVTIPIDTARIKSWSEFHPNLYTLEADIAGIDHATTTFGFRSFTAHAITTSTSTTTRHSCVASTMLACFRSPPTYRWTWHHGGIICRFARTTASTTCVSTHGAHLKRHSRQPMKWAFICNPNCHSGEISTRKTRC